DDPEALEDLWEQAVARARVANPPVAYAVWAALAGRQSTEPALGAHAHDRGICAAQRARRPHPRGQRRASRRVETVGRRPLALREDPDGPILCSAPTRALSRQRTRTFPAIWRRHDRGASDGGKSTILSMC